LYEISRRVEGAGGRFSGYSTRDMTAYWVKAPAGGDGLCLEVLEQLLTAPSISETAVESERVVICQERRRERANPFARTFHEIEGLLLLPEPLARHPVGTDELVAGLDAAAIRAHVDAVYHRRNLCAAAAGNLDAAFAAELEKTLGRFPDGPGREKPDFTVSSAAGESRSVIIASPEKKQAHLAMGWKVRLEKPEELFTWRVINTLLGAGYTSLLNLSLRERKNLTYLCTSAFNVYGDTGVFKLGLALAAENLGPAVEAIDAVLDGLRDGRVDPDLFHEAAVRHAAGVAFRMEDPMETARMMGQYLIRGGGAFQPAEYLARIEEVSAETAADLARRQLSEGNRKILVLTGSPEARRLLPDAVES